MREISERHEGNTKDTPGKPQGNDWESAGRYEGDIWEIYEKHQEDIWEINIGWSGADRKQSTHSMHIQANYEDI